MSENQCFAATGRRKTAVAKVRLFSGVGKMRVNKQDPEKYFNQPDLVKLVKAPLETTKNLSRFDVESKVMGGGKSGQAGALCHGVARALVLADPSLRKTLKDTGYLTRDSRMKERKKYGQPGARKRFQFSKR